MILKNKMAKKKEDKNKQKKPIKVSTLVFWLIIIMSILLVYVGTKNSPNTQIINIFSDILKVLAGTLAGAIAGERKNE